VSRLNSNVYPLFAPEQPPVSRLVAMREQAKAITYKQVFTPVIPRIENNSRVDRAVAPTLNIQDKGRFTFYVTSYKAASDLEQSVQRHPAGSGSVFIDIVREEDMALFRISVHGANITKHDGLDIERLSDSDADENTNYLAGVLVAAEMILSPPTKSEN
jgi:hypothetical protein